MTTTVATQTILDGDRLVIQKFTGIQIDATGETNVIKIQPSTLAKNNYGAACTGVQIQKIWASTHGLEIEMFWEASSNVFCWLVPQNTTYIQDFCDFGGLTNNAGTGKTGNLMFTTLDGTAGDAYTVVIEAIKTYG